MGKIQVGNRIVIQSSKTTFSLIYYDSHCKRLFQNVIEVSYPIKKLKITGIHLCILGEDKRIRIYYRMLHDYDINNTKELDLPGIDTFSCNDTHLIAINNERNAFYFSCMNSNSVVREITIANVVAVACGFNYSLLLTLDAGLYEIIDIDLSMPRKININGVYSIKCWNFHSVVLSTDGLYMWDMNSKNARKIMIKNGVAELEYDI